MRHGAASAVRGLVNAVLPPQCLACDALVATPGSLCSKCWVDAKFITAPQCAICGVPYSFDPGGDAVCGACIRARPLFDRARAVGVEMLAWDCAVTREAITLRRTVEVAG